MDVRTRNHVTVTGRRDGPTVMLAHGFGCDQNLWHLVTPEVAAVSRVVMFDYVGSGRSDPTAWSEERYSTLDGYADDVLEICRELDLHDVVFVGHSVSAIIGVLAVVREPERFSKLLLLVPSPRYIDDEEYRGGFTRADIDELLESLDSNYLGWSTSMVPVIMNNPDRPDLGSELIDSLARVDPRKAAVFARATFLSDNRSDLGKVTVPTLIVESAIDVIAPREVGAFVHASIPGSRLVTLDSMGHCPQLSDPEQTAEAITSFVTESGG
ncbi:alpha/beta hydrolase [Streptomyces sp. NPDC047108]|uniref:alpha/beta fold hydrolase n=1 Tax=Streptomyces sp. NPDC047108 TaxID=3155025 RepID=UPI0033FD025A